MTSHFSGTRPIQIRVRNRGKKVGNKKRCDFRREWKRDREGQQWCATEDCSTYERLQQASSIADGAGR